MTPPPINRRNVLEAPHSPTEKIGMEGSNGVSLPLYVPFSREGKQSEAERGEALNKPMTVTITPEITYEPDAKHCYYCQETRGKKTHFLFWFSSTWCLRICQDCARRQGGRIQEALESFLKPFDYRTKAGKGD